MARMLFFVFGVCSLLFVDELFSPFFCWALIGVGLLWTYWVSTRSFLSSQLSSKALALSLFCIGIGYAQLCAHSAITHRLPELLDKSDFVIEGEIVGLVDRQLVTARPWSKNDGTSGGRIRSRFIVKINGFQSPPQDSLPTNHTPEIIRLDYYGNQRFQSGQYWRFKVRLRSPRGFSNPGAFDYPKYLLAHGIDATGYIHQANIQRIKDSTRFSFAAIRAWLHKKVTVVTDNLAHQSIILALTFGDKSRISNTSKQLFIETGTAHLMVISGLHVGIAAGLGGLVAQLGLRLRPKILLFVPSIYIRYIGCLSIAAPYAAIAGLSVSTKRALFMLLVVILSRCLKLKLGGMQLVVMVVFSLLVIDPLSVLDNGLWLSVIAVLSLLLLAAQRSYIFLTIDYRLPTHQQRWNQFIQFIGGAFRAQWFLFIAMPIVLAVMNMPVSLISPLANLFSVPWFSLLVVPFSLLGLLMAMVNENIASGCFYFVDVLINANVYLLGTLKESSPNSLIRYVRSEYLSISLLSLMALILSTRRSIPGFSAAVVIWAFLIIISPQPKHSRILELKLGDYAITQLDVGQGTAILISTQNQHWLYDTGFGSTGRFDAGNAIILPYLRNAGINKLDGVIVSHGDNDHRGGLTSVVNALEVNQFYLSGSAGNDFKNHAHKKCLRGNNWRVDGVQFTTLHPDSGTYNNENDQSCVIRIASVETQNSTATQSLHSDLTVNIAADFKNDSAPSNGMRLNSATMLTGDISRSIERELVIEYGRELSSALLAVPHHGSSSSSSLQFLENVNPSIALVSAGFNNRYHHPSPAVKKRLFDRNTPLLRSDQLGTVQAIYRDGRWYGPYCARFGRSHFWQSDNVVAAAVCKGALKI